MTTSSVAEVFTNTNSPIANRVKTNTFKPNSQLDSNTVDELLEFYSPLIASDYVHWFAKRFYKLNPEIVSRLASEAKADGKDPKRLFSFLVDKAYKRA